MSRMQQCNKIVIHCSDTPPDRDVTADDIRQWHLDRGWTDIGYHYVVRLDGAVEVGRPLSLQGAHVQGHNADSIGICIVGGGGGVCTLNAAQIHSTRRLIAALQQVFCDQLEVVGHRDLDSGKACPCFDARSVFGTSVCGK